jgi:hypothetical protein
MASAPSINSGWLPGSLMLTNAEPPREHISDSETVAASAAPTAMSTALPPASASAAPASTV